jgi:hypothetical protein
MLQNKKRKEVHMHTISTASQNFPSPQTHQPSLGGCTLKTKQNKNKREGKKRKEKKEEEKKGKTTAN